MSLSSRRSVIARWTAVLALTVWLAGCRSTADGGGAPSQLIVVAG
jgi:hypothetical protein